MMGGNLAEVRGTCSSANMNCRRSSFIDMCQSASKRIGSQENAARESRRDSIHERLPIAGDSSAGGTPAALAARESALPESADDGDYAGDYDSVDGEDRCMAMKNGDNQAEICGADEVAALRELVQQQKEDLETAASIGQRLLDSNDDLSTKLETTREEKWLADCENEALRRDLEHATQRCEQLDDTKIEVAPEPEVDGFDLWSPATAAAAGTTRPSFSDDGSVIPTAFGSPRKDDNDRPAQEREREAHHLRQTVEDLQRANNSLREELVEALLETAALRHTSAAHEEAARDQKTREAFIEEKQEQQIHPSGEGRSASEEPWVGSGDSGTGQGERERVGDRPSGTCYSGPASKEPLLVGEASHGDSGPLPDIETKHNVVDELLEGLPWGRREEQHHRASDGSGGGGETKDQSAEKMTTTTAMTTAMTTTTTTTTARARLLRCQSSSAFRDTEEQAELIDALREQVLQLRAELTRVARAPAAGKGALHKQNGATEHDTHDHNNTGPRWSGSKYSSDDDSESDHGSHISDHKPHPSCPSCARNDEIVCGRGGGGGGGGSRGTARDRGAETGQCAGSRDDDTLTTLVLRERVTELAAELEAARCALDALRQRSKQDQAATLELQREILRLHVARHDSTRMSAEVVRASAQTSWGHHNVRHDHGGGSSGGGAGGGGDSSGNPGLEHPVDCLKARGLSWLSWLWRIFLGGREEDGTANGIEDSSLKHDAENEVDGSGNRVGVGGGDGDFAGGDSLGDDEGAGGYGYVGRGGDARRFSTGELAPFLNIEERKMV